MVIHNIIPIYVHSSDHPPSIFKRGEVNFEVNFNYFFRRGKSEKLKKKEGADT